MDHVVDPNKAWEDIMENVCPRCKLPQKGINECEYCGLVFRNYKDAPTVKSPTDGLKESLAVAKKGALSIVRIVGGILLVVAILIFIFPYLVNFYEGISPGSKKISDISYSQIINSIKKQKLNGDLTEAQLDAISKKYVGKRVRWTGWVFQVDKILSDYMLWVDMDKPGSGFSIQDVYLPIPQNKAASFNRKQKITFEGNIKSIDKIFGKYTIELKNVQIK